MTESKEIKLVVKIKNQKPVELLDLSKSLAGIASQFNNFTSKNAQSKDESEAKLYVKEIRSGSIILELVEIASIGVIPFIENTNVILEFSKYCKSVFDYFISDKGENPNLSLSDCKEFAAIVNPVVKDNGSQIIFSPTINGKAFFNFSADFKDANSFINQLKDVQASIKEPINNEEINNSVILTWYQARNEYNNNVGNKGVIEDISKRPLNITFENDDLKEKMLHCHINPFNTAFVVDVRIQTVQGKPVAYKVLKLHDYFDINNVE